MESSRPYIQTGLAYPVRSLRSSLGRLRDVLECRVVGYCEKVAESVSYGKALTCAHGILASTDLLIISEIPYVAYIEHESLLFPPYFS